MTIDADGNHFVARAQFRGFFAATWNDVANGPQRGPRVGEGAYSAHRAGEQIRRDMDYVRGFPRARWSPNFGSTNGRPRRRGVERGPSSYPALSSTSGPSSFLLNGWPNTSYAYMRCVLYDDFVLVHQGLCIWRLVPHSCNWHFLFAACDNR